MTSKDKSEAKRLIEDVGEFFEALEKAAVNLRKAFEAISAAFPEDPDVKRWENEGGAGEGEDSPVPCNSCGVLIKFGESVSKVRGSFYHSRCLKF
jgi:hypothetical protein